MRAFLPIILLTLVSATAHADDQPGGHEKIFIAPSGEPFRVAGDQPYPVAKWFAAADTNHDGKLDFAEFEADFMRFFDELDVNHDGAIDGVEKTRYENQVAPETLAGPAPQDRESEHRIEGFGGDDQGAAQIEPEKPRYGSDPAGAAQYDLLGLPEPVAAMDTELRGRISRRMAEEAARTRFNDLDAGNRGYLTLDALPPTYAEHHRH